MGSMLLNEDQCYRALVTHDARWAAWADRVIFLRDGRIVDQTDAPDGPESLLNVR